MGKATHNYTLILPLLFMLFAVTSFGQHQSEGDLLSYIDGNLWPETGLPQSYHVTQGYWQNIYSNYDKLGYDGAAHDPGRQQERFIMQYGLNLYDGACYQIAMMLSGISSNIERAAYHTRRLRTNVTLEWSLGTRGYTKTNQGVVVHLYGDDRTPFWQADEDHAFYFRLISELYDDWDPLLYGELWTTWQDWKPVAGENAWCGYIGPLQLAYSMWDRDIPWTDPSVYLAYNMLNGVEAMQNEIGAIYHVPTGVSGKAPNEISNENNFSVYAGVRMFKEVLESNLLSGNLLRNSSFETEGSVATSAYYWETGNPDVHGGMWGGAARENWGRSMSGSYIATVHGLWGGPGWGGWWQEVPTHAGLTNTLTAWFWADTNWTATVQDLKLEFFNNDGWMFYAVTNAFQDVTTNWVQKTVEAVTPADAVWVRAVVGVEGAGAAGALQFDDINLTAGPVIDVANTIARTTNILARMDDYFDNYLMNTNDGVFHTGGTYNHTNNVFTPYVFSGYWIGGPYRGSNIFSGTTEPGTYNYGGTNLYTGYESVEVTITLDKAPVGDQCAIRYPATNGPVPQMTRVSGNTFTYTINTVSPGQTINFEILPMGSQYGPVHSWQVAIDDPPDPYTSVCSNLFAVDCQTWGMAVLGAHRIDANWGENAAYDIWQNTKLYGGYYPPAAPSMVHGVGFSDINNESNDVLTAEWTFGAILMCRNLAADYREMGKTNLALDLERDADTMREGLEALSTNVVGLDRVTVNDGDFTWDPNWRNWTTSDTNTVNGSAYLYANKRYEIPFGWWANALPSMASTAWAIMNDRYFDPFVLGGGDYTPPSPWLSIGPGTGDTVSVEAIGMAIFARYTLQGKADLDEETSWSGIGSIVSNRTTCVWSNMATGAETKEFYRLQRN